MDSMIVYRNPFPRPKMEDDWIFFGGFFTEKLKDGRIGLRPEGLRRLPFVFPQFGRSEGHPTRGNQAAKSAEYH
jgi:hypothetical protein